MFLFPPRLVIAIAFARFGSQTNERHPMSTEYRPLPDIQFAQLFDGRLEKYGVKWEETAANTRHLLCCDRGLQVHCHNDGTCSFTQRGVVPWSIFDAIVKEFAVELVSEHEPRFWGFATEEEMYAALSGDPP